MINIISEKAMAEIRKKILSMVFELDQKERWSLFDGITEIIRKENRRNVYELPEEAKNEATNS